MVNCYYFVDRFYLGGQMVVGVGEFFEVKVWDFSDYVVNGWFKGSWGVVVGDVVYQFVKGIIYCQFGCYFSNWEVGGFRGQC